MNDKYTRQDKIKYKYALDRGKDLIWAGRNSAYYIEDGRYYDAENGREIDESGLTFFASDKPSMKEIAYTDYIDRLNERCEKIKADIDSGKYRNKTTQNDDTYTVYKKTKDGYISYKQSSSDYWFTTIVGGLLRIVVEIILLPLTLLTITDNDGQLKYKKKKSSRTGRGRY